MAKKRQQAVNVSRITRGNRVIFRARLTFPFNDELGYTPTPKDFYGATEREAVEKRERYKDEPRVDGDGSAAFVVFVQNEFIPFLRAETEPIAGEDRPKSYAAFVNRRSRLNRYLLKPVIKEVENCALRNVRLGYLKPAQFEDYFKILVKSRMVSVKTMRELRTDFRLAISYAGSRVPGKPNDFFTSDFVSSKLIKSSMKRKKQIFDAKQVLSAVTNPNLPLKDRALVATIFCTLCRPSEMFALQWSDIDFTNAAVTFDKAVRLTATGFKPENGTKVKDGTVPLFEPALSLLRELRKSNMGSKYVFTTKTGLPLHKSRFKRTWVATRQNLGLPDGPRFYDLKHTGNSFLQAGGVQREVRAELARHADTRMVETTYLVIGEPQKRAVGLVYSEGLRSVENVEPSSPNVAV